MASCHSWLRSCDFCCNLLLSSFVVILVVGFAPFCFSSLSFLLLCLGCILLIPHVCSLFIIVTLFRFLCLERSPTGRRGLVSRRLVRRRRRRQRLLVFSCLSFSFNFLISFSCCNLGLVFWKRDRLVVVCVSIIWFVMLALALVLELVAGLFGVIVVLWRCGW